MKSIIKDALILFAITIIAGLALGYVYEITKEPIAVQKQIAKDNACKIVFEDATSFEAMEIDGYELSYENSDIEEVLIAKDGEALGYVITVTNHEGYGGDITFMVGIRNDGTINAISFTSISETAGLGMKAKKAEFRTQFNGRNVKAFSYTKTGSTNDSEIDAISAATITTNAVTNGMNDALTFFYNNLGGVAANE